jgi:secondary thiamine-phosphate synthase enzyme
MSWFQKQITLRSRPRGCHVITDEILDQVPEIRQIDVGLVHLFLQHTSASLSLNENVSPDVRADLVSSLNALVPEDAPHYTHTYEGPDDMPAHVKSSLLGCELTLPITGGRPNLGTWQGIYLCEHRNYGGARRVLVTVWGKKCEG